MPSSVSVRRAESISCRPAAARPRNASSTAWHRVDVASTAGESGRDAQQPNDIETPTARARHRVRAPQRRERRARQHGVHPAVFTRAPRRGQRLVQRGLAVADSAEARQARGAHGVRLGFARGVVEFGELLGGRAHRGFDLVQALGVGEHRQLAVEARAPRRKAGGIARAASCSCVTAPVAETTSPAASSASQRATSSSACLVVAVGQLVVELLERVQRPVVQVGRTFVGQPRHRLVRGAPAVLDGLGRVARPRAFEVVVGQLGQQLVVGAGLGLQRRRDALVQPHAPHGRQLGEQRLPDDGVVEPVPTAGLLDDDARLARLVERVDEVLLDHPLDQLDGEPAADDRGRGKGLVRLRRQPRKPAAHGFPHTLRQRARVPRAAAFVDVAQRLDEEERVAAGDRRQRPGQLFVVVAGLGDVGGHVVLVEAAELQAVGGAVAVKVGEHRRQRMGAVEVGAAVRADDLHAGLLAEAQQMAQQQQRRLGRPVQVVEHQDDGCARGGDVQQRDDGVEQCVALGVRVGAGRRGQVGQHLGEPGNQWKKCFDAAQPPQPVACPRQGTSERSASANGWYGAPRSSSQRP